ncbi:MAG: hypothetical protein ACFB9M_05595 [Myxococcota bacterium]
MAMDLLVVGDVGTLQADLRKHAGVRVEWAPDCGHVPNPDRYRVLLLAPESQAEPDFPALMERRGEATAVLLDDMPWRHVLRGSDRAVVLDVEDEDAILDVLGSLLGVVFPRSAHIMLSLPALVRDPERPEWAVRAETVEWTTDGVSLRVTQREFNGTEQGRRVQLVLLAERPIHVPGRLIRCFTSGAAWFVGVEFVGLESAQRYFLLNAVRDAVRKRLPPHPDLDTLELGPRDPLAEPRYWRMQRPMPKSMAEWKARTEEDRAATAHQLAVEPEDTADLVGETADLLARELELEVVSTRLLADVIRPKDVAG